MNRAVKIMYLYKVNIQVCRGVVAWLLGQSMPVQAFFPRQQRYDTRSRCRLAWIRPLKPPRRVLSQQLQSHKPVSRDATRTSGVNLVRYNRLTCYTDRRFSSANPPADQPAATTRDSAFL